MTSVHDTHNAFPLAKLQSAKEAYESGENFRCCSECDKKVLDERLKLQGIKKENLVSVSFEELLSNPEKFGHIRIGFMSPNYQKRFDELGQNFYETGLGKSYLKNLS